MKSIKYFEFANIRMWSVILVAFLAHATLSAGKPENGRIISLSDLWGKYHYSRVFMEEEQREIGEALAVFQSERGRAMLTYNLFCFGKPECKKYSISDIMETDANIRISHGNTPRNRKALNKKFGKWFFHITQNLPSGSYPFANIFRAPFARLLQDIVTSEKLDLKISRQGVFPLYSQEALKTVSAHMGDVAVSSFIVVADFENIESERKTEGLLRTHPERQTISRDLTRLVELSGLADICLGNVGLNKQDGRLLLFDTEPLYGEILLARREFEQLQPDWEAFTFDFYEMDREELMQISGLTRVTKVLSDDLENEETNLL